MNTPIDPGNHDELVGAYWDALRPDQNGMIYGTGLLAVARAVCPEHHAVYDTRTHVAVPVAEIDDRIKEITESPWWDSADDAGETLYAVRDWLRSLLPKEATDGK